MSSRFEIVVIAPFMGIKAHTEYGANATTTKEHNSTARVHTYGRYCTIQEEAP